MNDLSDSVTSSSGISSRRYRVSPTGGRGRPNGLNELLRRTVVAGLVVVLGLG